MNSIPGADKPEKPSLLKRAIALLVIVCVVALVLKLAIGLIIWVFWAAVIIAAIFAILWALNTLL